MQHQEVAPPAKLRDSIQGFWYTSKDFGEALASFEVVPDGYVEIIFHFEDPGGLLATAGGQPLPSPLLVGLLDKPAGFCAQNQVELLGVRCFPWAVPELLGLASGLNGVHHLAHSFAGLHAALAACLQAG